MAEDGFAQLQRPKQISQSVCPKIQRVAHYLRDRENFAKYYSPRLVSLGPIHHGKPHLQLGEQYKLLWASMYVQGPQKSAEHLLHKISENIKELKDLYCEDATQRLNDEKLAWMLFVDGCSLLQILKNPDILKPEALKAKVDQLALVRQDVLLLENQVPFKVLKLLSPDNDTMLLKTMDNFLLCHHLSQEKPKETTPDQNPTKGESESQVIEMHNSSPPAHLLDQLRRNVLRDFNPQENPTNDIRITYRNIKELKSAGIRVKRSNSRCPINICFSSGFFGGELELPEIVVDDTIAPTYLNLIAYEVCPDFENKYEISSYVEFLDSLIDHPDDVKELRAAEVLHNGLGSDEEVASLFNVISNDLVPNTAIYAPVRAEIEKHYKKKYKTWFALAYHTYFSNPWAIIAFNAAFLALFLTLSRLGTPFSPVNRTPHGNRNIYSTFRACGIYIRM